MSSMTTANEIYHVDRESRVENEIAVSNLNLILNELVPRKLFLKTILLELTHF